MVQFENFIHFAIIIQSIKWYEQYFCLINEIFDSNFFSFFFQVLAMPNVITQMSDLAAKTLVAINFTVAYAISGGQENIPIDKDVTFWCTLP